MKDATSLRLPIEQRCEGGECFVNRGHSRRGPRTRRSIVIPERNTPNVALSVRAVELPNGAGLTRIGRPGNVSFHELEEFGSAATADLGRRFVQGFPIGFARREAPPLDVAAFEAREPVTVTRSLSALVRNEVAPRVHNRYGARSPRSSRPAGNRMSRCSDFRLGWG